MKAVLSIILFMLSVCNVYSQVLTGIDVLKSIDFAPIKGKKVGLITNPTGVDAELESTIDILHKADNVNLIALFAPEHGVRGNIDAGAGISTFVDDKTGIPVYSLYGKNKKPTPAMLKDIDVLIYDIQDIGCRSYTFISTMGKAMEACAENNIKFMVLDRPNPLGGEKVEGPLVDDDCVSFVSMYPIPYLYGLTSGELAVYLNEEGLLRNGVKADLDVVKMRNWERWMKWRDTGLKWILTSPHIPQEESAYFYPASGILGELDYISIGVGYTLPFQVFCAEWIDAEELTQYLNDKDISGWTFRPIHIKPRYGLKANINIEGVQPFLTDYDSASLTLLQFYIMEAVGELYPKNAPFKSSSALRLKSFDNVCGSKKIRRVFTESGYKVSSIELLWNRPAELFKIKSEKYYLYK